MYQLKIELHTTRNGKNVSKEYTTDAITEDGKKIADALYGIINDHTESLASVIESEINFFLKEGYTEGSIHGSTYNAEWELTEVK